MLFLEDCKRLYETIFILGVHIRKTGSKDESDANGDVFSEDDIEGSGAITKSATITFAIFRNKNAAREVDRNTTTFAILKNRPFSETTQCACRVFYRKHVHKLYPYSVAKSKNFFKDDEYGMILNKDVPDCGVSVYSDNVTIGNNPESNNIANQVDSEFM